MQSGEFLWQFFSEKQQIEVKPNGEANVLCPFSHDKGFETRPSAHINIDKGVFHCKTCMAEGRFNEGGLSEIGFVVQYFDMSYENAIKFLGQRNRLEDSGMWDVVVENLMSTHELITYLESRGISKETALEYRLAYRGDGIAYPVFVYGQLCDVRTYVPNGTPKMRSEKGASPLLFPFDVWRDDDRDTVLVAGENDCLIARQNGFNAVTVTGGEGTVPKVFMSLFKGKNVTVCYDCDEAGRRGGRNVAFYLHEAGANVRIADLGLLGTKEDKDVTDFFVKHGYDAVDFLKVITEAKVYSPEEYSNDKNTIYPLIDLWDVPKGEYSGKRISSRVMLSGKYDAPMQAPTAVEWRCKKAIEDNVVCNACPLKNQNGWWTMEDNLASLMELVDVSTINQQKAMHRFIGFPNKCPNGEYTIKARKDIYKVIFTPDVESEDMLDGFRSVEQYAYVIGMNLEDGARYRVYYKPYANPLDGQRVFMIVDRVEQSDNAINTFKLDEDIIEKLKVFQGDPFEVMKLRAEMAKDIVGTFAPAMIVHAVDIMYHSPLDFKFKNSLIKGYAEGLIIGESRTGKSDTASSLQKYYGVGNFTSVKKATTAGLVGGADKLPNGGFKVSWGTIPRNNRGLIFLDEMSGMSTDVLASMTDMRSSRVATVNKIVKGKAPASTRMLWISNPRVQDDGRSLSLKDYATGVPIVLDLVGSDEDVARFDFVMMITAPTELASPLDESKIKSFPRDVYRDLIYWSWSRTSDKIKWGKDVEEYVWQISQELNEKYNTDVKFFGAEAWKKVARIAVACALACFSLDEDRDSVCVQKEHVDWASSFLVNCYDNPVFRLREYAQERRTYNTTNESVNALVAKYAQSDPQVVKQLVQNTTPIPRYSLQAVSGMENQEFVKLISVFTSNHLITAVSNGFVATRRLRLAVEAYRQNYSKANMVSLASEGSAIV